MAEEAALQNMFGGLEGILIDLHGRIVAGNQRLEGLAKKWKAEYDTTVKSLGGIVDTYLKEHDYKPGAQPDQKYFGLSANLPPNAGAVTIKAQATDNKGRPNLMKIVAGSLLPYIMNHDSVNTYYMIHEYMHDKWDLNEKETYTMLAEIFTKIEAGEIKRPGWLSGKKAKELSYLAENALKQYKEHPYEAGELAGVLENIYTGMRTDQKEKNPSLKDRIMKVFGEYASKPSLSQRGIYNAPLAPAYARI